MTDSHAMALSGDERRMAVASHISHPGLTLRAALKERTRDLHDRLDRTVGGFATEETGPYGAFLAVQYAARASIERWALAELREDVRPPELAALIATDLAELSVPCPAMQTFVLPAGADWRGVAWALGGSALGNKALLAARRRAGLTGAARFLSDPRTAVYFRRMLPMFEEPATPAIEEGAVAAAAAVFGTFLGAAARFAGEAAA